MTKSFYCVIPVLAFTFSFAGCSSEPALPPMPALMDGHEHDHGHSHGEEHKHPETFADAVALLTTMRNTVRDGFANNDEDAAHGPLHEVGHLLESLEQLAEKADIQGEQMATLKTSVETLFNSFGSVDKMLHGGEGSTYSEVSDEIDAALKNITDLLKPADAEQKPEPDVSVEKAAVESADAPKEEAKSPDQG